MVSAITNARPGSEFDRFLYASIGDDRNGMPLTVLSALARSDVDPWEEASKLAQLPEQSAVTQLAFLLGALQHDPLVCPDPAGISAPLIALLPRTQYHTFPVLRVLAWAAPSKHPAAVSILVSVLAYVILLLFSNWLMGSLEAPVAIQPATTSLLVPNSPNPPTSSEAR